MLLDADQAELYGVETKALVRAVNRTIERFPSDCLFLLTEEEFLFARHGKARILKDRVSVSGARGVASMPNLPDDQTQSAGPQAYRPASSAIPDIPLADADAPGQPNPAPIATDPSQQVVSSPNGTNPFGLDIPDARDDDPKATMDTMGLRPEAPVEPLSEDQIAADSA